MFIVYINIHFIYIYIYVDMHAFMYKYMDICECVYVVFFRRNLEKTMKLHIKYNLKQCNYYCY